MQTSNLWDGPLPFGADGGISTDGDVLVNVSSDGVDLNIIFGQIKAALDAWNAERGALTNLLSFWTTDTASAVPQAVSEASFEEASEYGIAESHVQPTSHLLLGYEFDDFDFRTSFTWKFLRDATAEQILAQANMAIAADEKLVQGSILQRLFDNTPSVNNWGHTIYSLFNGDSTIPPSYLGKSFTAPRNHYAVSQATEVDSGDLEELVKNVTEHGFGMEPNSQLICLVNPAEAEAIASFRAGVISANDAVAKHDYIPSSGSPAWLTSENIMGQQAPAQFNKLRVNGSYGPLYIIQSDFVPEKYVTVFATYGPGSADNLIGVRQHPRSQYQGLRHIPGLVNDYPLQDSHFQRSMGTGTRRRGAAAVCQIKEAGSYDVPEIPR